jgi:hypothetical protein
MLRWLRVLFSREFDIAEALTAWDYFFADIDY